MNDEVKEKSQRKKGCSVWGIACGLGILAFMFLSLFVNVEGKSPAETREIFHRIAVVIFVCFVPWIVKVFKGEESLPSFGSEEIKSCLRLILLALCTLAACVAALLLIAYSLSK